jgi:hypothetical protein
MRTPIGNGVASLTSPFRGDPESPLVMLGGSNLYYDERFGIGFTEQEKADLLAFLRTF